MNEHLYGDQQVLLPPGAEHEFMIELPEGDSTSCLLLRVSWSSARLGLLPGIPLFVFVRRRQLEAMARAVKREES
jgi:hypothetical protein